VADAFVDIDNRPLPGIGNTAKRSLPQVFPPWPTGPLRCGIPPRLSPMISAIASTRTAMGCPAAAITVHHR